MKYIFPFVFFACCFQLNAQPSEYAKINTHYYMSKYEVSNGDYKKYLDFLNKSGQTEKYKESLPDTSLWKENKNNEPYSVYYFSYPSYSKYPVIGVSYEDAVEYCKWLTDQYNLKKKKEFQKVIFRLPSKDEWIYAADGGDKNKIYTWNTPFLVVKQIGYMCNFRRVGDNMISYDPSVKSYKVVNAVLNTSPQDKAIIPAPVQSYPSNLFGIYNMCGNVSEMINQKGIAMGGSYNDPGYDVRIESEKYFSQPSIEIGFRVLMEVIK